MARRCAGRSWCRLPADSSRLRCAAPWPARHRIARDSEALGPRDEDHAGLPDPAGATVPPETRRRRRGPWASPRPRPPCSPSARLVVGSGRLIDGQVTLARGGGILVAESLYRGRRRGRRSAAQRRRGRGEGRPAGDQAALHQGRWGSRAGACWTARCRCTSGAGSCPVWSGATRRATTSGGSWLDPPGPSAVSSLSPPGGGPRGGSCRAEIAALKPLSGACGVAEYVRVWPRCRCAERGCATRFVGADGAALHRPGDERRVALVVETGGRGSCGRRRAVRE